MKRSIYLDYAAATPMAPSVIEAMQPYFSDRFYNPSALYLDAKSVSGDVQVARQQVAGILGSKPAEIVFTAGGTEANNLAIHGVMQAFPDANMIVSGIEHESVLEPAAKYDHKLAMVLPDGRVDVDSLRRQIDSQTVLVSIMYANNEIGTIQPIREISQMIAGIRNDRFKLKNPLPLYLHTDACQAANYLDLHVSQLYADLMTLNAGKIYGPKQCGALYVRTGVSLHPQILGGGQERGIRSGTENVANIVGFATALQLAQADRANEGRRLTGLRELFIEQLQATVSEVIINGSLQHRLPNNVHVTFPGQDNERLLMQLDEQGILCATGSACTASNDEPSHVLKAIGISDTDAQSSLRFTMGRQTTEADIKMTVSVLQKLLT